MLRLCSILSANNPRERIEALYECLAPFYAILHPFVKTVAARATNLLDDGSGLSALDVCTGTGVVAQALAQRGYDVTGIDIAFSMLTQRRHARTAQGIKSVRMDARQLAFPDRTFDVCAISMGLHEFSFSDRFRILNEMMRVSRRYVLVADYSGKQPWMVRLAEWLEASHFRDFIDGGLDEQLSRAGLNIIRQDRWFSLGLFLCEVRASQNGNVPYGPESDATQSSNQP